MKKSGSFMLIVLSGAVLCCGRTLTVDDDIPADFNNIQAAIDDANDGDVIVVQPGVYDRIHFKGRNIIVRSCDPTNWSVVAITRIGEGGRFGRAVQFRGTEDPNCTLSGFSIGGSIYGYDSEANPDNVYYTKATISYCDISRNQTDAGNILSAFKGTLSNCLITENRVSSHSLVGPLITGGGLFANCTIANNTMEVSGLPDNLTTFINCIIYNTNVHTMPFAPAPGAQLKVRYCNIQTLDEWSFHDPNTCNIDVDPLFVDPDNGDYHLKSRAGRWDPNSGHWVRDEVTSQCIDAGDPASPVGPEPFPNGGLINMGAYGGTAQASKSYFGGPVCETIVAGDINGDCVVDLRDYAILAMHWLTEH